MPLVVPRDVRDLALVEQGKAHTRPTRDHAVAALAARQRGVVTLPQLRDAGLTDGAIEWRVRAGRLHRVHRRVYAVGHPGIGQAGRHLAATLATGGVLSHRSAAAVWGLLDFAAPIHVTAPTARRQSSRSLHVHGGRLAPADMTRREAVPVTTVARTLLDCAESMPEQQVVALLDRGESLRLIDVGALRAVIARSHGRRGLRTLRAALLIVRPDAVLTRSELERRALRLIGTQRLPRPEVNVRVGRYEIDLLWRERGLAVELDGRAHHGDGRAFERDRRRDADLVVAGWRVVRFTWRQVLTEPEWVAAALRSLLIPRRA